MSTSPRRRVGFTLVELLVVITIIGMLAALLLPAIGGVRARARQNTCMNNLRTIGQATINYESSKGTLPGYVQPVARVNSSGVKTFVLWQGTGLSDSTIGNTPNPQLSFVSWAAILLPKLDRQDIWDRMTNGDLVTDPVRFIDVLVCPDDSDANSSPDNAGVSYVANGGAWDTNNGLQYIVPATGVGDTADNGLFHNLTLGKVTARVTVTDGAATTLMYSENMNKNPAYSWLGLAGGNGLTGEAQFAMTWVAYPTPASGPDAVTLQQPFNKEQGSSFAANTPEYARPSSRHPNGSFNVVFLDGHTGSLSPTIDYEVYQALLTPNGSKCVDPRNHTSGLTPPSGPIYQFRARPPLSDKDLL